MKTFRPGSEWQCPQLSTYGVRTPQEPACPPGGISLPVAILPELSPVTWLAAPTVWNHHRLAPLLAPAPSKQRLSPRQKQPHLTSRGLEPRVIDLSLVGGSPSQRGSRVACLATHSHDLEKAPVAIPWSLAIFQSSSLIPANPMSP